MTDNSDEYFLDLQLDPEPTTEAEEGSGDDDFNPEHMFRDRHPSEAGHDEFGLHAHHGKQDDPFDLTPTEMRGGEGGPGLSSAGAAASGLCVGSAALGAVAGAVAGYVAAPKPPAPVPAPPPVVVVPPTPTVLTSSAAYGATDDVGWFWTDFGALASATEAHSYDVNSQANGLGLSFSSALLIPAGQPFGAKNTAAGNFPAGPYPAVFIIVKNAAGGIVAVSAQFTHA